MAYETYTLKNIADTLSVTFDAVPDESISKSSGVITDTTISKKAVYWYGARVTQITLNGKIIDEDDKNELEAIITENREQVTYSIFYDGITTNGYKVILGNFALRTIVGMSNETDEEGYWSFDLTLYLLGEVT